MKFHLDVHNTVVVDCFKKMNWTPVGLKKSWNICWITSSKCAALFAGRRMLPNQMVNHFPNSAELCRKDLLLKNIRRYNRQLKKDEAAGTPAKATGAGRMANTSKKDVANFSNKDVANFSNKDVTDFFPVTFEMPKEYELFLDAYSKDKSKMWIMKPVGKCHGNGIFLANRLAQVEQWSPAYKSTMEYQMMGAPEQYVISKYVTQPMLIDRKKFDMRLYVLVTSFRPLKAYLFNRGICRICTLEYTNDADQMENGFVHLTNASIQKQPGKINKITIDTLKEYLDRTKGKAATHALVAKINSLIVHSLKAVQPIMFYDRHCFECYGYDVMIDKKLKPWLIEINSSPSLFATSKMDCTLKKQLVSSILNVILPPDGVPDTTWNKRPSAKAMKNFQLLIDEESA